METIKKQLEELLNEVEEGNKCPLRTFIELKDLSNIVTAAVKKVEGLAMDEADKYPERSFDYFGAVVSKSASGARYNWNEDRIYNELSVELKQREEILKRAAKYDELIIDEETGEQITKCSIKVPSKSLLRISFNNG